MTSKQLVTVVLALCVLATVLMSPAAAQTQDATPALVVELREDGSAEVTVRLTYDLESDAQRAAFRELQNSQAERDAAVSRFRERMGRVADAMATETNRETSVTGASIALSTADDGSVGVVELSVDWTGFAATTDGELTVGQPFAGGYDPDRRLVVVGPQGYEPDTVRPSPTSTDGRTLRWSADADLNGFRVTFVPAGDPPRATGDGDGSTAGVDGDGGGGGGGESGGLAPGFGPVAALVALAAAGLLAGRRGG